MDDATLSRYIREIGRGRKAARDLPREDAQALFAAMLAGTVPPLQLGAVLIALRVKGESLEELAGFAAACEVSYEHLQSPAGGRIPVVIPAYNGARQLPNLVPLLALLLAREGIPVLIHGVTQDRGRVTTCEVLTHLGVQAAGDGAAACAELGTHGVGFLPIDILAPQIAALLAIRRTLGVRNSAHTLVKMLQPFAGPAVRIVSVTHPDYLVRMREYFTRFDTGALLMRGAEGEAVAHPRREPVMEWAHAGAAAAWAGAQDALAPALPASRDPDVTARWIESVLAGEVPVPAAILHQVACCRRAVDGVRAERP